MFCAVLSDPAAVNRAQWVIQPLKRAPPIEPILSTLQETTRAPTAHAETSTDAHACAFNCLDLKTGHTCYYCSVAITFQSVSKKAGEEISKISKTQYFKTNLQDQYLSATAEIENKIGNLKKPPQKSYSISDWIKNYNEAQAENSMFMSRKERKKKKNSWGFSIFISKPDFQVKKIIPTIHMKLKKQQHCSMCNIFCFTATASTIYQKEHA